jgi:hypothetical protein
MGAEPISYDVLTDAGSDFIERLVAPEEPEDEAADRASADRLKALALSACVLDGCAVEVVEVGGSAAVDAGSSERPIDS